MSIAVPESLPGRGVTVAEVNLKLIWDVVSRIQVGKAGYAYVVDGSGQLLAHPDLSLVLQRRDFSLLRQVQAARRGSACCEAEPTIAADINGRQVLTARAVIDPPGWSVFVEQPLEEAFAPLYVLLARIGMVLVGGLVVSVFASLLLARRMTSPIRELQAGAARIGAGALDHRIDVRTGDELEALGNAFNQMTAHLSDSYSTLEGKVEERTRDLAEALTRLEAQSKQLETASRHKSEFLANMSHELRTPLNAINGFSQVLLERLFGDVNPRQEEYLKDILSSGRHLLSLINDILDLSKVEAGRMDLQRTSFSLSTHWRTDSRWSASAPGDEPSPSASTSIRQSAWSRRTSARSNRSSSICSRTP
jgi:two-component system NtrC family sensor kinase